MSVLVTLRAVPVVLVIDVARAGDVDRAAVVAMTPWPLVVSMSRPPPVRVRVWPLLPVNETALQVVVLRTLEALLKVVEPPVLPDRVMPPPASLVSAIGPVRVTVPPLRPVISALAPVPLLSAPG